MNVITCPISWILLTFKCYVKSPVDLHLVRLRCNSCSWHLCFAFAQFCCWCALPCKVMFLMRSSCASVCFFFSSRKYWMYCPWFNLRSTNVIGIVVAIFLLSLYCINVPVWAKQTMICSKMIPQCLKLVWSLVRIVQRPSFICNAHMHMA